MGAVISAGTYNAIITAGDADSEIFSEISFIKNGTALYTWNPNSAKPGITQSLATSSGDYYYVKVTQS
jgi:hypothetical protein